MSPFDQDSRNRQRVHSSHDRAIYSDVSATNGVPLRCQFCSHQSFRRSGLRAQDFTQILLMRYPVRCLRCGQRQMVSFTVASISLSSSAKPRKSFEVPTSKHWIEPTGDSGSYPNARQPAEDRDTEV